MSGLDDGEDCDDIYRAELFFIYGALKDTTPAARRVMAPPETTLGVVLISFPKEGVARETRGRSVVILAVNCKMALKCFSSKMQDRTVSDDKEKTDRKP